MNRQVENKKHRPLNISNYPCQPVITAPLSFTGAVILKAKEFYWQ